MASDDRDENPHAPSRPADTADVLFAVDLKRLVRASADDDDDVVSDIRERYGADRSHIRSW
ncbi:hypothetical protein HNR12_004065 [Streptomonospora nanhaiensis]|uniref:Uncharacterized protein n=1 Tax=Streptomonospora nanhaiensis TaxID=1323731 RepID=A0A853BQU8_9ACTN|nr:hypothetical protein [Streptomonospora nanhaiensis]NYI97788.1 hypothetical protein [Streptomonospora nanhaiensis]